MTASVLEIHWKIWCVNCELIFFWVHTNSEHTHTNQTLDTSTKIRLHSSTRHYIWLEGQHGHYRRPLRPQLARLHTYQCFRCLYRVLRRASVCASIGLYVRAAHAMFWPIYLSYATASNFVADNTERFTRKRVVGDFFFAVPLPSTSAVRRKTTYNHFRCDCLNLNMASEFFYEYERV